MAGTRAPSRSRRLAGAIDLVVVALVVVVAVAGFAPTFGGSSYLVAAGAGASLGLGIAWLGAWRRWSTVAVAAVAVAAYFGFGGVVVLRDTTLAGVLPSLETLRLLALGAVTSWKGLLTIVPPVDAFPELGIVPFLSCLVTGVLAGSVALRARRPGWAMLPLAALNVGVILLGTAQVAWPIAQAVAAGVVGLAWTAWRRVAARSEALRAARVGLHGGGGILSARTVQVRRLRNATAVLVAAGLVTAFAAPVLQPSGQRQVLRDTVVPPLDLREYPSPLVGFRRYVKDFETEVLFTVAGLPTGARLRLATMDAYTGTVIDVAGGTPGSPSGSGSFTRLASTVPTSAEPAADARSAVLTITVGEYAGVWLPDVGQPLAAEFTGDRAAVLQGGLYANSETGTALSTAGLREGDQLTVRSLIAPVPAITDLASTAFADLQLPAPERVPQSVASVAAVFVGDAATPVDQVSRLREALATGGVFSDGLDGEASSRAGHGADRIDTLLSGAQMVGDDEQFAVTMALMARQLGIPARVVMGFYPEVGAPATGGVYAVTGTDAHAWVEIAFAGVGWVPLDPTPSADQPPQAQDPRSKSAPQPQVLQEPPPPEAPAEPPLQPIPDAADANENDTAGTGWTRYLILAGAIALPIVLLASPFMLILGAKSRRRRRRLGAVRPVDRLSGGWSELLDVAADLGSPVLAGATRRENARELQDKYPDAGSVTLAERADDVVFGEREPTDADVAAFWGQVEQIVGEMSRSAGRWRRLRGRFSVRSLPSLRLPEVLGRVPRALGRVPRIFGHLPAIRGRARARSPRGAHR